VLNAAPHAGGDFGVTVVVPLYNKETTIARAVQSALDQHEVPLEVVVVDDGSTDRSIAALMPFGDAIQVLRQANAGPSAARNAGATVARHPYLVFLDGDDVLRPGCLDRHRACITGRVGVRAAIASALDRFDDGTARTDCMAERLDEGGVAPFAYTEGFSPAIIKGVASGAICVERGVFQSIGRFDERLRCWEITEFLLRLATQVPVIGLHREVGIEVNKVSANSQFERNRHDSQYLFLFAESILSRLDCVPAEHRNVFSGPVRQAIAAAWAARDGKRLTDLLLRARPYTASLDLGKRLPWLGRIPGPLLHAMCRYRAASLAHHPGPAAIPGHKRSRPS
jgi:glycosyltransferase involved in cell wall biosynthesis